MKRVIIITALTMLALAGCKKSATGPSSTLGPGPEGKTTEITAADRRASELMPVAPAAETVTATETAAPAPTYQPADATAPTPTETEKAHRTYTVRKGDTLWAIARRLYGDGKRYRDIVQFNHITDPNKIYAGQVLQIPQ